MMKLIEYLFDWEQICKYVFVAALIAIGYCCYKFATTNRVIDYCYVEAEFNEYNLYGNVEWGKDIKLGRFKEFADTVKGAETLQCLLKK